MQKVKKQRRVLFVFSIIQYFIEAKNIAVLFKENGWQVSVMTGWIGDDIIEVKKFCEKNSFFYYETPHKFSYSNEVKKFNKTNQVSKKTLKNKFLQSNLFLTRVLTLFKNIIYLYHQKKYFKTFFKGETFDVVFSGPYSSCAKIDNVIAKMCKCFNIKFFCFPVFGNMCKSFNVESRKSCLRNGMLSEILYVDYDIFNKLVARFFPEWTKKDDQNNSFFMHEPTLLLSSKLLFCLEDNVWDKPSKNFDLVFVESKFAKKLLLDDGWHKDKIIISGKPSAENIIKNFKDYKHKRKIINYFNLKDANEKFILFNIEPTFEHNYSSQKDHWSRIHKICNLLLSTKKHIVISLHPLCQLKNYKFLEKQYNFKISKVFRIFDLFPYSLFVVSHLCTTNFVANNLGIKTIVFDWMKTIHQDKKNIVTEAFGYDNNSIVVNNFKDLSKKIKVLSKNTRKNNLDRFFSLTSSKIIYDNTELLLHNDTII